ncbi:MAG: acyl-CoA dehydrogenase family protein [Deltaproteobacteria bacterium]|nr:acyl-CoA dehydrogenase family protein [Deltaproteobacteria bacterium]
MAIEFELTAQQQALLEMARSLARDVLRPISLEADRKKCFPEELLLNLQRFGVGAGGSTLRGVTGGEEPSERDPKRPRHTHRTAVVGAEELAWGDAALPLSLPGPGLGGPPMQSHGTPAQRERFFAPFKREGELHWGAYGLTEPGAGSDVSGIATTCRRDGDHWVLNGRKCFITNGARADWVVIFATVDRSLGRAGHRAFVVEKGTPGFSVGRIEDKLGLRASETAELVLDDCRVPAENLLGGEARYEGSSEGFLAAMKTFDATRPLVGAMAIGIGRASYERARDLLKARYVLSRPVPRYGALRAKLAEMKARLDAARMLVWRAAWMADLGLPNAREASMAKAAGGGAAVQVCADAIELVGADGCATEGDDAFLEKWFRDIKVYDIFEGTGHIQRIVIARRLLPGLRAF